MNDKIKNFFAPMSNCIIRQVKEWAEIFTDFETKNKYEVFAPDKSKLGFIAEKGGGFWGVILRNLLRSHRPMEIKVWDASNQELMTCKRPFFWFFSDLSIYDTDGNFLGSAHRKFGIIYKKYQLLDSNGKIFSSISSPLWKLWQFPLVDYRGNEMGIISKKWGGVMKEIFTDADTFNVTFSSELSQDKKAVIFATAITIDLDFFEDNQRNR